MVAPSASAAQEIAGFASSFRLDDPPKSVLTAAKLQLLDTFGCALAAYGTGVGDQGARVMAQYGGRPAATTIGQEATLPPASAAFANAMLSHALDFDTTHADSVTHLSAIVGPVAMAVAERHGATGADLLAAFVVGTEVVARVGMTTPGEFTSRGFHTTAVCGIFGGVAAAARLGAASDAVMVSALGIAGSFAGGLFAYLDDGTATKPVHPAWAAHGAVLATDLAVAGIQGPPHVFEGRFGVFHSFLGAEPGSVAVAREVADFGERWETARVAIKAYPVCHLIHGVLGAIEELREPPPPDQIDEIEVTVPAAAKEVVLEPAAAKVSPRSGYERKFSLQFCVAAALAGHRIDVGLFPSGPVESDPTLVELAGKVRYVIQDYPTWPRAFPGGIRIRTRDGEVVEAEQLYQTGGAENPMTEDQVVAKYRSNAALALDLAEIEALERAALGLEGLESLEGLSAPLRRARVLPPIR